MAGGSGRRLLGKAGGLWVDWGVCGERSGSERREYDRGRVVYFGFGCRGWDCRDLFGPRLGVSLGLGIF